MCSRTLEVATYILLIWVASCLTSDAQTATEIVASTLILEAGGEYSEGAMQAVYEVIVNRSAKRQLTEREVCLQAYQFSCWNGKRLADLVSKAKRHPRWLEAVGITQLPPTNYTKGADHYHADYCNPYWNKHMKVTAIIGRHIFYK